jgi:tetratricopeptide (TPR) repeat protein
MIELLLAADALIAAGRLDQAERLFEQVAEADPRNAIAVVGLARVALERGDAAAALALARRALEIDPDEAAARRIVAQLEALAAQAAAPAETETEAAPAAEIAPLPAPARRSWLDRLIGFLRGR